MKTIRSRKFSSLPRKQQKKILKYMIILYIFLFLLLLLIIIHLVSSPAITPVDHSVDSSASFPDSSVDSSVDTMSEPLLTVCLDAGHGYDDVGCISEFLNGTEADVNMALVQMLKEELENSGIRVLLTHDGTTYPSTHEIITLANQYEVNYDPSKMDEDSIFSPYERVIYADVLNAQPPIDLFISIHINSIENHSEVSRYELYYYEKNPSADKLALFCSALSDSLDNETVWSASTYDDAYIVTKFSSYPSILIETGYASNPSDAANLNSESWRRAFCQTLTSQIIASFT